MFRKPLVMSVTTDNDSGNVSLRTARVGVVTKNDQHVEPEQELTSLLREYMNRKRVDVRDEKLIDELIQKTQLRAVR